MQMRIYVIVSISLIISACSGSVKDQAMPSVFIQNEWKKIAVKLTPSERKAFESYVIAKAYGSDACWPAQEAKTVAEAIEIAKIAEDRRLGMVDQAKPNLEAANRLLKTNPYSETFNREYWKRGAEMDRARRCLS